MNAEKGTIVRPGWTMEDDYDIDKRGVGDFFLEERFFSYMFKERCGSF